MDNDKLNNGEPVDGGEPLQEDLNNNFESSDILNTADTEIGEKIASELAAEAVAKEVAVTATKAVAKLSIKSILTNLIVAVGFTAVFGTGLIVMFYPNISNYVNQKNQSRAVQGYVEAVSQFDDTDYESYIEAAREYNKRIAGGTSTVRDAFASAGNQDKTDEYWDMLSIGDSSVMGYVIIESIGVEVPLYHGTSDIVLSVGAGHIQGSSLPVGGESTHTVVSAHTGLPSAKFFDNLDTLEIGDTFSLRVMNEVLTYQVDQILVVLPEEVEVLAIEEGEDYATLVTCTPYGINSHRLLVRGTRIETPPEKMPENVDKVSSVDEQDRLTWVQKAENFIVEKLAAFVEFAAGGIISIAEWGMDIIGVEY